MKSFTRSFGVFILCVGLPFIMPGQARAATRSTVFTNPAPADLDEFGTGIAAVGPDKIIIGAYRDDAGATDAGAAYLFTTSGKLLTTFTNPTPTAEEYFGSTTAAVGTDKVLIGAYCENTRWRCSGAAYLFRTDGALLMTFTNPVAKETDFFFGSAVAAMGPDKVLIGASGFNDETLQQPGAAFLFSTDGNLQTIFTNPQPAAVRNFGLTVAALGTDRIIVGAVGRAFLFNTNGALLTTFTNASSFNPGDFDYFGPGFTTVGGDKVLIGAPRNDWAGTDSGQAYLFDTNGAVLITFHDPAPGPYRYFGSSFAVVGTNVVIGGYDVAHVFTTDGTYLESITSPSTVSSGSFGLAAAIGNNQFIISDSSQPVGDIYPGAAYLYSLSGSLHDGGIADLVPCDGPVSGGSWKNHRQYVNAVIETARNLFNQGVLTRREKNMVIRSAIRSDCGRQTK